MENSKAIIKVIEENQLEEYSKGKRAYNYRSLDEMLMESSTQKTMGEIVHAREGSQNARAYTVASMIFNAVFEKDIELMKSIITRVDGTVPSEKKRDEAMNLFGDAIDTVLDMEKAEQIKVVPEDTPIIAMAKVLVHVATEPAGGNQLKRKERNLAANIILERVGGRKVEPSKPLLITEYKQPDWMGELPDGQQANGNGNED